MRKYKKIPSEKKNVNIWDKISSEKRVRRNNGATSTRDALAYDLNYNNTL